MAPDTTNGKPSLNMRGHVKRSSNPAHDAIVTAWRLGNLGGTDGIVK
jgi:hypothetical protein